MIIIIIATIFSSIQKTQWKITALTNEETKQKNSCKRDNFQSTIKTCTPANKYNDEDGVVDNGHRINGYICVILKNETIVQDIILK